MSVQEHPVYRGQLTGHKGWITAIATSNAAPDMVISASRDRTIIVWELTRQEGEFGIAKRRLVGHNHYVQDVALTSDGKFALTGSWDGTLRLWDLTEGTCRTQFNGHTKDVMSVALSLDNRLIASGSRDRTVRLWNTLGVCKSVLSQGGHSDWVSCVRFSPSAKSEDTSLVSGSWDKTVKVWKNGVVARTLSGHEGFINTITVSPDGSLCASGGKDGVAMLWDIETGACLSSLNASEVINALAFSPVRYWLCAATASSILIWDLESKVCIDSLKPDFGTRGRKAVPIECVSLAWSADGSVLFAGYTDNVIRCYQVTRMA